MEVRVFSTAPACAAQRRRLPAEARQGEGGLAQVGRGFGWQACAARHETQATQFMKRLLHKNVTVKRGAHGLGLFATGPVRKGAVVAEYWGEIVTEDEMIRSSGKYFFALENHMAIDGKSRKNMARYINHSCAPNCEPQENEKQQRVFITAKRNIKAGEEFGYDYGREYWDEHIKPIGCRCGCGGNGPKRWR